MKDTPQNRKKLSGVIAQAWMSNEYKQNLLSNPKETLIAAGVTIRKRIQVKVVEDTDSVKNIILDSQPLPAKKSITELPSKPSFYQVYAFIYSKCITDAKFKKSFLANPTEIVKSLGINLPDSVSIVADQNTETLKHFTLPVAPKTYINTKTLQNEVEMFATDPVNANANINANANVNVNGDVNINGALQVNGAAVATVVVAVAVLI